MDGNEKDMQWKVSNFNLHASLKHYNFKVSL